MHMCAPLVERRRFTRHRVSGQAEIRFDGTQVTGVLLDIGSGGVLIGSDQVPAQGSGLAVSFHVDGYPKGIEAQGRVVRTQMNVLAVVFSHAPAGIEELLAWLEKAQAPS